MFIQNQMDWHTLRKLRVPTFFVEGYKQSAGLQIITQTRRNTAGEKYTAVRQHIQCVIAGH